MTSVRVRPICADDHRPVRALAPELMSGMPEWRPEEGQRAAVESWVDAAIATAYQAGHAVFVAADANDPSHVLGFVSVGTRKHFSGDKEGYVGELVVDPAVRKAGIGRSLMAAAEDWVRERGLSRLSLETGSANDVALAAYAHLGYVLEQVSLTKSLS